jgi:hypothetical protein
VIFLFFRRGVVQAVLSLADRIRGGGRAQPDLQPSRE